jgi:hypothetical protein
MEFGDVAEAEWVQRLVDYYSWLELYQLFTHKVMVSLFSDPSIPVHCYRFTAHVLSNKAVRYRLVQSQSCWK